MELFSIRIRRTFQLVSTGYAAPEQPGYATYPVHVFLFLVGCGLHRSHFIFLQGVAVQKYKFLARHLPYGF